MNLARQITIGKIDDERLGQLLKQISVKGQFTFAYNNQTIPADSLISTNGFNGSIYTFLSQVLGSDYEYRELPGYIVLRRAPNKMELNIDVDETKEQQVIIKGTIFKVNDRVPVAQVSVYEKNQLVSTLTNNQGYFELVLKNDNSSIVLTASKENFRDTSFYFLREVAIGYKKKKKYKYYPGAAVNGLEKGVASLLISSKQRVQDLNLGGFFAFSPYQVSLTPGLSSHGLYSGQVVDHVSLNLLGGYTAGVQGIELAGLFNIDRWNVSWLQAAGAFNIVGGNTSGIQLAGIYNQVLNKAGGLQVAGIVNSADEVSGIQFAGLFNIAKKVKGVQIAGLFNVADSSDYPIALVNFIKNGHKSLSLSYDEAQYTHIDYRSGGRVLYGLTGAGYYFNHPKLYAFDMGFGAHIFNKSLVSLDFEYSYEVLTDFQKEPDHITSFRLPLGVKLSKRLGLFAAPGANLASYTSGDPLAFHGWEIHKFVSGSSINNIYAGLSGGLQVTW